MRATRVLSLLVACGLSGAPAQAQAQLMGGFKYQDVAFTTNAEGRRVSAELKIPIVSINDGTTEEMRSLRLFVRDRNIETVRGPHDRVCAEATDGKGSPNLFIAPVGSAPNGRILLSGIRRPNQKIECMLVPTAERYRLWTQAPRPIAPDAGWQRWSAPPVFSTLEYMGDQADAALLGRNIDRIADSLGLDGVCFEVPILRAGFEAPDGAIGQERWALNQYRLASALDNGLATMQALDKRIDEIKPAGGREPHYFLTTTRADLLTDAFVSPNVTVFAPFDLMKDVLEAIPPPDPNEGWPVQDIPRGCGGTPLKLRNGGALPHENYLAYIRVFLMMPYWGEYAQSAGAAKAFWERYHHELMMHELVHLHDSLQILDDFMFQAKGTAQLQDEFIDRYSYQTQEVKDYGLSVIQLRRSTRESHFSRFDRVLNSGNFYSVAYFHTAIYNPTPLRQPTTDLTVTLEPFGPRSFGNPQVLREALRKAAEATGNPLPPD